MTTPRPRRAPHDRTPDRPLRALAALPGAAALLGASALLSACTESTTFMPLESLDGHDALVEEVAEALEAEGVLEEGSTGTGERGAQWEKGQCRVFARGAEGATVETQPSSDTVSAAVDPVLEDSGFTPLEETGAHGGHLQLESTDDQGASVQITWKAHELRVSIHGTADLPESECTDGAVG